VLPETQLQMHINMEYGVRRLLQAGVIPITTESLVSEWMHDWNNPKADELVKEVYSKYGAMVGFQ